MLKSIRRSALLIAVLGTAWLAAGAPGYLY
jgi:hypothetical protein